jgi:hypothetical protein
MLDPSSSDIFRLRATRARKDRGKPTMAYFVTTHYIQGKKDYSYRYNNIIVENIKSILSQRP